MLRSVSEVNSMIEAGRHLFLGASAETLAQLHAGSWIAGSSSYFMVHAGGTQSSEGIFVTEVPPSATATYIRTYTAETLGDLYHDAPAHGFTFLCIPAESPFLNAFARDAHQCDDFLLKPVVGWVAGVPVDQIGKSPTVVVDGRTRDFSSTFAVALHVELPPHQSAELSIVNIFEPGGGDSITFPDSGPSASECLINGTPANFAEYLLARNIDTRLPLTADYCGNTVNVAFKLVDAQAGLVHFYGCVVQGVEYHLARPIPDYAKAFSEAIAIQPDAGFSCNCILNFLYGELAGKHAGHSVGPFTFGEIAYLLLSQTLVQLRINDHAV